MSTEYDIFRAIHVDDIIDVEMLEARRLHAVCNVEYD